MAITRSEVERIAQLARLELPAARAERMAAELSRVLEYVEALRRLDLEGCAPSTFAPAGAAPREDDPDERRLGTAAALAMAPEAEQGFFLVPPVVENLEP